MSKRYPTAKADEWVQPVMRGYRMACCDCGLVHELDFRVIKAGRIGQAIEPVRGTKVLFLARRNNRSTAAIRRARAKGAAR